MEYTASLVYGLFYSSPPTMVIESTWAEQLDEVLLNNKFISTVVLIDAAYLFAMYYLGIVVIGQ